MSTLMKLSVHGRIKNKPATETHPRSAHTGTSLISSRALPSCRINPINRKEAGHLSGCAGSQERHPGPPSGCAGSQEWHPGPPRMHWEPGTTPWTPEWVRWEPGTAPWTPEWVRWEPGRAPWTPRLSPHSQPSPQDLWAAFPYSAFTVTHLLSLTIVFWPSHTACGILVPRRD